MDGTFNKPFAQGQSPSTPDTPSGGTYQVNVNRTKTRKWVEAKVQSYDGDDWGADEFDDDEEEPEPMPPVPRVTTGLRPVGQRLPSETRASPRLPATASSSRSASGPPSLHLQTGQSEEEQVANPIPSIPAHIQDPLKSTPSPTGGRNPSPVLLPSQRSAAAVGIPEARSSTPQSVASSAPAHPSPLARPAGLSQSAGEDKKSTELPPPAPNADVKHGEEATQSTDSSAKRYPELDLPDIGRVSLLESDFLSGSGKDEAESSGNTSVNEPTAGLKSQAPVLSPVPDPRSVPPLRTPSPQAKGTVLPVESQDASLRSDITPTEPLQPRRSDHSPSDFEPQPIQREPTMSTTTSSPVKESDMLSDEIMRSLSPAGAAPTLGPIVEATDSLAPHNKQDPRDSSYTLSDYDSYWADGKEKSSPGSKDIEPAKATTQSLSQNPQGANLPSDTPPNASTNTPSGGDSAPSLRRQFSWEAIKDQPPANQPPQIQVPSTNDTSPHNESDAQSAKDAMPDVTGTRAETPKIVIPSDPEPSTAPQAQPLPSMLEPSSPVSTRTEESAVHLNEDRRPSIVEEKMLVEPPTPSETPLDAQSVMTSAPSTKPGQMPQVMGLKEIMGLPSSTERLNQYEESRQAFAVVELGLKNWIQSLKNQHPEYANATGSFGGVSYQTSTSGPNAASSSGSAPVQQPYYQQYLNASSPATTAPPTSRSRLGGLPLSTQAATSAFGNSSNQIGTKSKEFMHSAGKMGKGLFSKGRSKLRGTGDKGEPIPPPVMHPNVQNKRRSSWGMSVSARSRMETAIHSEKEMTSLLGQDRPQSSHSGRMHPFRPASWAGESGRRHVSLGSLGPFSPHSWGNVPQASDSLSEDGGQEEGGGKDEGKEENVQDVTTWDIPTSMDKEETLWAPSPRTREPGVTKDDSSEHSGVQLDEVNQAQAHETVAPAASIDEDSDEEWVEIVSPHSTAASVRMVPAEPALVEARPSLAVARGETRFPQAQTQIQPRTLSQTKNEAQQEMSFTPIPRDPGPSNQQHAPQEAEIPQRNPSFVGLPPIRRGSTFGLTPKAARSAAEHISLDEDEEYDVPLAPAPAPTRLPGNSTASNGVALNMTEPISPNSPISQPEVTLPLRTTSTRMPSDPEMATSAPPEQPYPVTEPEQDRTHPHSPGSPDQQQQQNLPSDGAPHMIPPNMVGNPIQRLPPAGAGNWKLEESHLSEPLHSVSRNRAGTGSSQQHSIYGLDKETGGSQHQPDSGFEKETGGSQHTQPPQQIEPTDEYDKETGVMRPVPTLAPASTPVSPTSPIRHRNKPSDVPPSTTNRYPELFRQEDPRPRANPQASPPLPGQQFQQFDQLPGHFFQSPAGPDAAANPDAEGSGGDRGRRKSSGLFKELGSRFTRPSERQGSIEHTVKQPPPAEHIDDRSEPEFPIDEMHPSQMKPPKGSFLSSLRGRASMDRLSQSRDDVPGPSQLQGPPQVHPDEMRPGTPHSQSERKHTRFASLGVTSGPFKLKTPGMPVSSASSVVNEPGATEDPLLPPTMAPPKKRFSGFGARSGMFGRSSLDAPPKPGTPGSVRPSTGHQNHDPTEFMDPPPSIASLARSTTDGAATPLVPPKMPGATTGDGPGGPEPRKRRGSASGLISGFLGHVRNRSQSQGNSAGFPPSQAIPGQGPPPIQTPPMQGPPNQLPPGQNPLGQHPPPRSPLAQPPLTHGVQGQPGPGHRQREAHIGQLHLGQHPLRPNPQVQIPSTQGPNGQPASGLAPQLPPLGHMSPVQLQEHAPWGQLPQGQLRQGSPASQPLSSPPMLRQITGNSSLNSQVQTSTERPSTGGQESTATSQGFTTEDNPSQSSLQQPQPSPLQRESMKSDVFPKISNSNGSPQLYQHFVPIPGDDASVRMQPESRGASPTPSVPLSHVSHHASSKSLDNVLQTATDVTEAQRISMHSTNLSLQSDIRTGHVRRESYVRDDLPTSPVSQMSRTGPPSIASSHFNQSPPLTSTGAGFNRRESQPGTPSLSAVSNTPPMQAQGFGTQNTTSSPALQQQHQQQQTAPHSPFPQQQQQPLQRQVLPPSPSQQQPGTQQGNFPPSQQVHTLRTHPSTQTMPSPSSQVSMHVPRSSMQMQGPPGPQVPPKNTMPLGPPSAQSNVPSRTDSPASKWKGLKNRMSSQMAPKPLHDQEKPEAAEKKTSKLFNAFKRSSKVPPPEQNVPQGFFPPGQAGHPQGVPQQRMPQQRMPQQRIPQQPMPQQRMPQQRMPQQRIPQQGVPLPQHQMQPGRQTHPGQHPQQFMVQAPPPQGYARPPHSQPHSPTGQQLITPMANVNPQMRMRQSPPVGQQPFHPMNPAIGQQPRPSGPPAAPAGYVMVKVPGNRQPGPPGPQIMNPRQAPQNSPAQFQPQRPPQRQAEPQYAQVPIPKGYAAVHGEGIAVPAPYYINRDPSQAHFPPQKPPQSVPVQYTMQQASPQSQSPAPATSPPPVLQRQPPPQVQTPLPQSQPQPDQPPQPVQSLPASPHPASPHDDGRVTNGFETQLVHTDQVEHTPAASRGGSVDASWHNPQVQRAMTNNSHSSGSGNSSPRGSNVNSVDQVKNDASEPRSPQQQFNENGLTKFDKPRGSVASASPQSLVVGVETLSRPPETPEGDKRCVTVENGSRPISLSPPTVADGDISRSHSQAHSSSAVSDEQSINTNVIHNTGKASNDDVAGSPIHQVKSDNTGESEAAVALGDKSNGTLARSKTRNRGAPAELEDTTDAHARKMRLQTQEEKIHYDPDADSDGEPPPQMSATSYPGQEWNPYGMPEYGEWNE